MKGRIIVFSLTGSVLLFVIGYIFWEQELKYAEPTPVPANFHDVKIGVQVKLGRYLNIGKKNVLLHFYNPDCPCSRFTMKEIEGLTKTYQSEVQFYVIIQSKDEGSVKRFNEKYELNIPVILDATGAISDLCGIYATPQAVVLNKNSEIYFKGNYNRTRFCTRKETRFAEMAIQHLLKNEPLPSFILTELSVPYGCELPSDLPSANVASNLFN